MNIIENLHKKINGKYLLIILLNEALPGIKVIKILKKDTLYIEFIGYVINFGNMEYRFGYYNGEFKLYCKNTDNIQTIGTYDIWRKLIELGFDVD